LAIVWLLQLNAVLLLQLVCQCRVEYRVVFQSYDPVGCSVAIRRLLDADRQQKDWCTPLAAVAILGLGIIPAQEPQRHVQDIYAAFFYGRARLLAQIV